MLNDFPMIIVASHPHVFALKSYRRGSHELGKWMGVHFQRLGWDCNSSQALLASQVPGDSLRQFLREGICHGGIHHSIFPDAW